MNQVGSVAVSHHQLSTTIRVKLAKIATIQVVQMPQVKQVVQVQVDQVEMFQVVRIKLTCEPSVEPCSIACHVSQNNIFSQCHLSCSLSQFSLRTADLVRVFPSLIENFTSKQITSHKYYNSPHFSPTPPFYVTCFGNFSSQSSLHSFIFSFPFTVTPSTSSLHSPKNS